MSGRKGLVAVTALTVSTMLLGGGALSAFAAERGGRGHGDDRGATPQYQYVAPAAANAKSEHETAKRDDDDEHESRTLPAQTTQQQPRQLPPGLSVIHPNNGQHVGEMREHEDEGRHNGDGFGNIVRHRDDDDDDLVTAPARVTETPRPCMGDDDDHGCKRHHGDDDDQGEDADTDTD